MDSRQDRLDAGDLTLRTLNDYKRKCQHLLDHFGKGRRIATLGPSDFAAYKRAMHKSGWGLKMVEGQVMQTRIILKWAYDIEAVDRPIRVGPEFKPPSKKRQRIDRLGKPRRLFSAEQIHALIEAADVQMRAMILLGINCSYGNADCGRLQCSWIDYDRQWLDAPRGKTGIHREAWLWPETIKALPILLKQITHSRCTCTNE